MRVIHHISCNGSPSLSSALKTLQVEFTEVFLPSQNQEQVSILAFDIGEANEKYPIVLKFLPSDYTDIPHLEFSEKELLKSDWLTMRCTNSEFDLSYVERLFPFVKSASPSRAKCKHIQWGQLYLSKPINWKKKHFASSYDLGTSFLFCDDYAKKVLEQSGAKIMFETILHSRTKAVLENNYFMHLTDELPLDAIAFYGEERAGICEACGQNYYLTPQPGTYQLHIYKSYLQGRNCICKTPDVFALAPISSHPFILVSQTLYRQLREKHATKNLVFEPVILV